MAIPGRQPGASWPEPCPHLSATSVTCQPSAGTWPGPWCSITVPAMTGWLSLEWQLFASTNRVESSRLQQGLSAMQPRVRGRAAGGGAGEPCPPLPAPLTPLAQATFPEFQQTLAVSWALSLFFPSIGAHSRSSCVHVRRDSPPPLMDVVFLKKLGEI